MENVPGDPFPGAVPSLPSPCSTDAAAHKRHPSVRAQP